MIRALGKSLQVAALTVSITRGVAAQGTTNVGTIPGAGASAGAGSYFESYTFSDPVAAGLKRVSLLTVPFVVEFQPVRWARFGIRSAFASGVVDRADGTQSKISGLTDTALELSLPLVQDRVQVAAALMLPFGKATYTSEEAQVAGIIAADLLPFALSHWGSGGSLDVSTQATGTLGALNVGARVGYQLGREFELLEQGLFSYRPGGQLYAAIAADGDVGEGRVAAQVTMYTFGDDQRNSRNLYRTGNRIQGLLTYSMPAGRTGRLQTYVSALRREHGTFADGSLDTPAQTMLLVGGGLRQPFQYGVFIPLVDVRLVSSSDGLGQGYIGDVGMTAELPVFGGSATLRPTLRARFGTLKVRAGVESGITGFDVGAGFDLAGRDRSPLSICCSV